MGLPNPDIASAFIETYITIRKESWGLNTSDNNDTLSKKIHEKAAHKIAICQDILQKFNKLKSFTAWLNILDDLYRIEKSEEKMQQERHFLVRLVTSDPLIANVLRAARTYIISEIKSEPRFTKLKSEFEKSKKEHEKEILWDKENKVLQATINEKQMQLDAINKTLLTRDDSDEYYHQFFINIVKKLDPVSSKLDEKNFEDFKENIINQSRTLTLCQRLLKEVNQSAIQNNENTNQSQEPKSEIKSDPTFEETIKDVKKEFPPLKPILKENNEKEISQDKPKRVITIEKKPTVVDESLFSTRATRNRRKPTRYNEEPIQEKKTQYNK